MQKEQFKELCKEFRSGNTNPCLAKKLQIKTSEFTQILKAYKQVGRCDKLPTTMQKITILLIKSGMYREEVMRLTGYSKPTVDRLKLLYVRQETKKELCQYDKSVIEQICEKFGLDKDRTIKEQWF